MSGIETLQWLIERHTAETRLADGTPVRLRPVIPTDKRELADGFGRLSAQSRYYRFLSMISELSPTLLRLFTEIDYIDHFALGALSLMHEPPLGVGVARYVRDANQQQVAEPAVTVVDAFQGRGLGGLLLDRIMVTALANGITRFRGTVLTDNTPMKRLLLARGARFEHVGHGVLVAEFELLPAVGLRARRPVCRAREAVVSRLHYRNTDCRRMNCVSP